MMMTKSAGWAAGGLCTLCMAIAAVLDSTADRAPAAPATAQGASPRHVKAVPRSTGIATPIPTGAAAQPSLHAVELAVQRLRAAGAGEDEVYRLRAGALPARTIAILTEREQAEQQWMRRIAAWRAERAKLDPGDSAAQRALRTSMFSADEQTRLDADEPGDVPRLTLP